MVYESVDRFLGCSNKGVGGISGLHYRQRSVTQGDPLCRSISAEVKFSVTETGLQGTDPLLQMTFKCMINNNFRDVPMELRF